MAYSFIGQYFFTTKPDYNVAVVAPYYLPDDTVTALQEQLARYGEDLNGDGKTVVTLNVYTLDYSAGDTQTESDAYLTMAGTTKLATDVAGGLSSVFLLYDPAGFQESTGSLRYLDGTLPEAGSDSDWWNMVYRWTDCPVLTGLDLGEYDMEKSMEELAALAEAAGMEAVAEVVQKRAAPVTSLRRLPRSSRAWPRAACRLIALWWAVRLPSTRA